MLGEGLLRLLHNQCKLFLASVLSVLLKYLKWAGFTTIYQESPDLRSTYAQVRILLIFIEYP